MTARLVPALIATLLLTLTAHAQTAPPPGIPRSSPRRARRW